MLFRSVRLRITSVNSTSQITSAMKMVSAAKLKRAQDAITTMRPYANKLKEILENVSSGLGSAESVFSQKPKQEKNILIVAISSNRGLAGAFNANIIKRTNQLIKGDFSGKNVSVVCIGKKVADAFRRSPVFYSGTDIPSDLNKLFDALTFDNVRPVAESIMNAFKQGKFDKIVLVYNQFKNAAVQVTLTEQFLPVSAEGSSTTTKTSVDYIFSPDVEFIVSDLIPRSLKTQLFKALLDSNAAEHGARMTAMHKATDNAKEMLRELRLTYNKADRKSTRLNSSH